MIAFLITSFMLSNFAAAVSDECLYMDACSEDDVEATELAIMEKTQVDLVSLRVAVSPSKVKTSSAVAAKLTRSAESDATPLTYGDANCRCIGLDNVTGMVNLAMTGATVAYPNDFGARCHAWDAGRHPECNSQNTAKPAWCSQPWCFVDPCKCNLRQLPHADKTHAVGQKFQGRKLFKSYATCAPLTAANFDSGNAFDVAKTCWEPQESRVVGNDDCLCIGFAGRQGLFNASINGKNYLYPRETGATCRAWDSDHHPECKGMNAPSWCTRQWCFVDPCSCQNVAEAPEPANWGGAMYQGRPLYKSHATCGDIPKIAPGLGNWAQPGICR